MFVRLDQVETPTVRITGIIEPVRTNDGALHSPLIVELETDAPVGVRVEILDDEGNTIYATVEELDGRSNTITWDGGGADIDTSSEGNYTVVVLGGTLRLTETPLTHTFSILGRAERKGYVVWQNGRGTPLFPLPVQPLSPASLLELLEVEAGIQRVKPPNGAFRPIFAPVLRCFRR